MRIAGAKEMLEYNKRGNNYGVAEILGVTAEDGIGQLKYNYKPNRNMLHTYKHTHTYT